MNILIINHYAGSLEMGMEFRPYYLAKHWNNMNHNVSIIASSYSHLRKINKNEKENIYISKEDGIDYYWIKSIDYGDNGAKRLINTFQFSNKLYSKASYLSKKIKPDVIIVSSPHPFAIYGAHKMSKISGAKLIFEIRDLWPLSLIELHNMSPYHPFIYLMQKTENYAIKHADAVTTVLPYTHEYIANKNSKTKIGYFPNGVEVNLTRESTELPLKMMSVIKKIKNEKGFLVVHPGTIGVANSVDTLINAAKQLKDSNIHFLIVGEGDQKDKLITDKDSNNLNNVHFFDRIEKNQVQELLRLSDIGYLGWKDSNLYKFGVSPNKLMDYLFAEKPVIQSLNSKRDLISDYNCGITVPAENPAELARGIKKLASLSKEQLKVLGMNGKLAGEKHHKYENISNSYLEFMEELLT